MSVAPRMSFLPPLDEVIIGPDGRPLPLPASTMAPPVLSLGLDEPPAPPEYQQPDLATAAPQGFRERLAAALAGSPDYKPVQGATPAQGFFGGLLSGASRGFVNETGARTKAREAARVESNAAAKAAADRNYANILETWKAKLRRWTDDQGQVTISPSLVEKYPDLAPLAGRKVGVDRVMSYIGQQSKSATEAGSGTSFLGTPANVTNLSQKALSQAAGLYVVTGKLPGLGIGGQAGEDKKRIMNTAADLFPGVDIAQNSATFGANKTSLSAIQKLYDSATAFESTALKNAEVLKGTLKGLFDSGSPLVNGPIRALNRDVLGDTNMAAFSTAIETVKPEFARLLSSPGASGMLTDTARKEMEAVLSNKATVPQLLRSIDVLTQDAENRRSAYQTAIDTIRERIGTGNGLGMGATTAPNASGAQVQRWIRDPKTGKPVKVGG